MAPTDAVEPLLDRPERPTVEMVATLGEGDGFVRALERAGVAPKEADEVARLVAAAVPLDQIKAGTTMNIVLGRRPNRTVARPLSRLVASRPLRPQAVAEAHAAASSPSIRTPISVDDTPLRIQGYVGSSLYRSARAAGAPAKAVEAYIRAVASQTSISGLTPDDRFDIILEHRRAATGEAETGRLLYAGLDRGSGKDLQAHAMGAGRPRRMVRGLGRRPRERRAAAAGAGHRLLQFRNAPPPDPRLFADAQGPRFPGRLRHPDPRRHRRHGSPPPAGRAAMATRSGSPIRAASSPPTRI